VWNAVAEMTKTHRFWIKLSELEEKEAREWHQAKQDNSRNQYVDVSGNANVLGFR
jgi:hypothetical protein